MDNFSSVDIFVANANTSWSIWKRQQESPRVSEVRLKIRREASVIKKVEVYEDILMSLGLSACANGRYQALFPLPPKSLCTRLGTF